MKFTTDLALSIGDFDGTVIEYDHQPAEWDTNTAEDVIPTACIVDGKCILDDLSLADFALVEDACWGDLERLADYEAAAREDAAEAMREARYD